MGWIWAFTIATPQRKRVPRVIPDGFLSVGVQRHKRQGRGRLSYVLQEENDVVPLLALEMVSQTYGQEYDQKLTNYAQLGVKYYVIYNPEYHKRHQHVPFEVYKYVDQAYQLQSGEPVWMPELELGIGRVRGHLEGIEREWLAWHNQTGVPYPLPLQSLQQARQQVHQAQQQMQHTEQRLIQAQQRAEQERQRAEQERQAKLQLLEKLRELGIDPDALSSS